MVAAVYSSLMKKVLVIQSRSRQEMIDAERQEYTRSIGNAAEVSFASTLDLALQWKDPKKILDRYDGVILGGSGEFDLHGGRTADDPARMTARQIVDRIRTFVDYVL